MNPSITQDRVHPEVDEQQLTTSTEIKPQSQEVNLEATSSSQPSPNHATSNRTPSYEVQTRKDGSHDLTIQLPGVAKNDIDVTFENKKLVVSAFRSDLQKSNWEPLSRGLNRDPYRLTLQINRPVDVERITAKHENGVLKLHLPLAPEAASRKVQIT